VPGYKERSVSGEIAMLRWVAKGLLLLMLGGATVAVVVRLHRSAAPDAAPPADGSQAGGARDQAAQGLPPIQSPMPAPVQPPGANDLGDVQAIGHALVAATHPAERGALLARLDPSQLRAVRQFLTLNPPTFDGPRHHIAIFDAERYGNWLTARADVDAHLRNGAMVELLADYMLQSSRGASSPGGALDARAVATLATLPDAVEVAEVLVARGLRATVEERLNVLVHGAAGDVGTLDTLEQARLALMIAADDMETTQHAD